MATSVSSKRAPGVRVLPESPIGWWAVGCAAFGTAFMLAWQLMPFGAWPGFILQVSGGVLALVAIIREKDRALTVIVAVMSMLFLIWFITVELLSLAGVLPEH